MRVVAFALAAVAALAGCDQIFGIDRVSPWDAQLPIDAPNWRTSITWLTYDHGAITEDPIDGLTVQVGALDTGSAVTSPPPLDPAKDDGSGTFEVPYHLGGAVPYRLVFTGPDMLPTEIQTTLQGFGWGFPIYGRQDRSSVAPTSTISGSIGSAGGAVPLYLVTTGLWSVTADSGSDSAAAFTFDYGAGALSLSGALGVPSGSAGDTAIVVLGAGGHPSGYAVFGGNIGNLGSAALQTGGYTNVNASGLYSPLSQQLNDATGYTDPTPTVAIGPIPDTGMPALLEPSLPGSNVPQLPVMVPLTSGNDANDVVYNPLAGSAASALVAYGTAYATRAAGSAYLTTSLQSIAPFDSGTPATPTKVGIAIPAMTTFGGVTLDADDQTVPLHGAAMLQLQFAIDQPNVDDCIATVYLVGATLQPLAHYIITAPPPGQNPLVMINTQPFQSGSSYTFGIHCEVGHDLTNRDYRSVTYPFSASTLFSGTFQIQ